MQILIVYSYSHLNSPLLFISLIKSEERERDAYLNLCVYVCVFKEGEL